MKLIQDFVEKHLIWFVTIIFSLGFIYSQFQVVIKSQNEMTTDLKEWKAQIETRLGRNSVDIARLKENVGIQ